MLLFLFSMMWRSTPVSSQALPTFSTLIPEFYGSLGSLFRLLHYFTSRIFNFLCPFLGSICPMSTILSARVIVL